MFKSYYEHDADYRARVRRELAGKHLACHIPSNYVVTTESCTNVLDIARHYPVSLQ